MHGFKLRASCMLGRYVTSHASVGRQKSEMAGKSTLSATLEPQPKQRYSENLAFVPTEPFLTRLAQSYTQQLVTTVRSVLYRDLGPRSEKRE